jgi:hypothetical protein
VPEVTVQNFGWLIAGQLAGTMLACFLVSQGRGPEEAIAEVRASRPGSIADYAQQACVFEYAPCARMTTINS